MTSESPPEDDPLRQLPATETAGLENREDRATIRRWRIGPKRNHGELTRPDDGIRVPRRAAESRSRALQSVESTECLEKATPFAELLARSRAIQLYPSFFLQLPA